MLARLAALVIAAAITNPTTITFSQDSTQAPRRALSEKLADWVSAKDQPWGAKGDGSNNDAGAINTAISALPGTVLLPASSFCYNLGSTGITITQNGRALQGMGMGGASAGPSCVVYSGSTCAITIESASYVAIRDLEVQLSSSSATAAAVCIKATTGIAEFNLVENVSVRAIGTRRVAGQVGLLLQDTGNGIYWNTFRRIRAAYWDVAFELIGGATQGVNENTFIDLMSWGHNTAFRAIATGGGFVADNTIDGLKCSRSDGTMLGTMTCLLLGDDGTKAAQNKVSHMVSDQSAPSVCGTIGHAGDVFPASDDGGNVIFANCESGGAITDNNTGTTPNFIYEPIAGSTPGRLRLGRLSLSKELSLGATPATVGDIRLTNNQIITVRNAANSADITIAKVDTNDRASYGTTAAFLRLNNNILEHGTGTVANSGNERFVHNWSFLGRNSANSGNAAILGWGTISDTLVLGDASFAMQLAGSVRATNAANSGNCTLNGGSPATCTATVPSGAKCVAVPTGTTATAATHTLATSVSSTTLTVTGANALTDVVAYHCF
jgi:hypothetical protein